WILKAGAGVVRVILRMCIRFFLPIQRTTGPHWVTRYGASIHTKGQAVTVVARAPAVKVRCAPTRSGSEESTGHHGQGLRQFQLPQLRALLPRSRGAAHPV